MSVSIRVPVADPDLQMGAGGHPDPEIRGGRPVKKKTKSFWPFGPHFGLEVTGDGSGPPGPLPWIHHCVHRCISGNVTEWSDRSGLVIRRVSVKCGVGSGRGRDRGLCCFKECCLRVTVRVKIDTNLTLTLT